MEKPKFYCKTCGGLITRKYMSKYNPPQYCSRTCFKRNPEHNNRFKGAK